MNCTGRTAIFMVVLLAVGGCASTGSTSSTRTNSSYISHEEIVEMTTANTLYDVVQQLRPRWLTVRAGRSLAGAGTSVVVYQGNSHLGDVDVLRQFAPDAVYALRYLDGATASASLPGLGSRHVEGAIVLITDRPRQ